MSERGYYLTAEPVGVCSCHACTCDGCPECDGREDDDEPEIPDNALSPRRRLGLVRLGGE